jgi:hypothetical protein
MPYTTVVSGQVITAAWANANVRDQTIASFADQATLTSQVGSPNAGMVHYVADVKQFKWRDGVAWQPIPGQLIRRYRRTTSSSTTTSEVGVLRIDSITIPAGQAVEFSTPQLACTSATNDVIAVRLRYNTAGNATTASPIMPAAEATGGVTNTSYEESRSVRAVYIPSVSETISVLLSIARITGAGATGILASADNPIDIYAITLGYDPGSVGTNI